MTISQAFITYWPMIAFIIGGIVSVITIWMNLNKKVDALKSRDNEQANEISELKGRVNLMQPTLGTIQTDIAVIKNTLEYIKGSVQNKPPVITTNNN